MKEEKRADEGTKRQKSIKKEYDKRRMANILKKSAEYLV